MHRTNGYAEDLEELYKVLDFIAYDIERYPSQKRALTKWKVWLLQTGRASCGEQKAILVPSVLREHMRLRYTHVVIDHHGTIREVTGMNGKPITGRVLQGVG